MKKHHLARRCPALLLACCLTLPATRATEYIIEPSGTTSLLEGNSVYRDGDIITLFMSATQGNTINTRAMIAFTGNNGASFTIRSGDGQWHDITDYRVDTPGHNVSVIGAYANYTYTFNLVNFANNVGDMSGAAIALSGGGATLGSLTTITGTMAFTQNGSPTGARYGGAIYATGGVGALLISGSIVFDRNFSSRGGAVCTINNATLPSNVDFKGDILFVSNTSDTYGGAVAYWEIDPTGTLAFWDHTRFINNIAGNGGAVAGPTTANNASWLTFSGTTLFQGNSASSNGGALYVSAKGLYIGGNTTFTDNKAGALGGAIYQQNGVASNTQVAGGVLITLDATDGDILFQNNTQSMGATFSLPGERNAITFYSGTYTTGGTTSVTLHTGAGADAHTIWFYDPIRVSNTANLGAPQTNVNITQTGDGTVVYDTYKSVITHTTTIASGTMLLTNDAIYGASGTHGYFKIENGAIVAGNGTVQAATIAFADGAQVSVTGGGTLAFRTTAFSGAGLWISGNGTIDTGGLAIPASRVAPSGPAAMLTFDATAPLTLVNDGAIEIGIFGGTTSARVTAHTLAFTPGSAFIDLHGMLSGTYNILNTINTTFATNDFTILVNGYTPTQRYAVTATANPFGPTGSELIVDYSAKNIHTVWTGSAPGGLWANTQGINANWTDNDATTPEMFFVNGDGVLFDDTAASKNVTIDAAGVTVTSMTVSISAGNDYAFNGPGAIHASNTYAYAGSIVTPDGKLTKTGAGSLNFANGDATTGNTFETGIEISGGAIGFTRGNQLGGGDIHFTNDATLRANATGTLANTLDIDAGRTATLDTAGNTLAYTGLLNLAATGTLAKTGAGILALTADNAANTGKTAIQQGTLALAGAGARLGGDITIATGATLAGTGTATGNVTAAPGAIIAPGAASPATPATLYLNNLSLDSSILSFNLFTTGTNDRITIAGSLALAGTNKVDVSMFQTGTYNLGNLAALAGVEVTIGGVAQTPGARQVANVTASGADLLLETGADISRIITWTGASSATWISSDSNWTDGAAVNLYAGGDRVIFNDNAPAAPRDIDIAGTGVIVSDMIVSSASNHTFTGAGILATPESIISGSVLATASGAGKLLKQGAGTLAFDNAANTFTGGIEIAGGAITFTNINQLGAGAGGILITGDSKLASLAATNVTLDAAITIAAGVSGTLDTGANTMTLTGALAAAAGAGTLAKTGAGQLVIDNNNTGAGAANLTIGIQEGSLLMDNVAFDGALDLAAGTLFTAYRAIDIAGIRATANATVQLNNASLDIGDFQLAGGSTLAGAGTLNGAATLNGLVTADIAACGALTLSGTVAGTGGFLKTGAGELRLVGAGALRNTGATQIDQGLVNITEITAEQAPLVSQTMVLNGGNLALASGTGSVSEATASDWAALRITQGAAAASGTITGVNDIIHVGAGSQDYAIRGGIIVAVDAGDGATVLANAANNFTGIVRVDSGTLQVTSSTGLGALGTGASARVALAGGDLRISSTLITTRSIEMRADATVSVDDGIIAQWAAINKPAAYAAASFTKSGSGTLIIGGANQSTGVSIAEGRYIARTLNSVNTSGTVSINSGAVFEFSATHATFGGTIGYAGGQLYAVTTSGTVSAAFAGGGTLEVTQGQATFASPGTTIAHVNITGPSTAVAIGNNSLQFAFAPGSAIRVGDDATLVLAALNQDLGNVTLDNGGRLAFLMSGTMVAAQVTPSGTIPAQFGTKGQGFKNATLASLAATGTGNTLHFNSNLALGFADHLAITGATQGDFAIAVTNFGDLPRQYYGAIEMIKAPGGATATFTALTPTIDIGLYKYTVNTTTSASSVSVNITGTGALSNSAALINTMAGALPLSWFTELDTVSQRLGELRFESREGTAGSGFWMRGYGQQIDYNEKASGQPFGERQFAAAWGYDHKFGGTAHNIHLGGYAGYGSATRHYDIAGAGATDSYFGGAYVTIANTGNGWYVDALLKLNGFNNKFTAVAPTGESTRADYSNWAVGGSIEAGKFCSLSQGWFVEPQIQAAVTIITSNAYTTDSGMAVLQDMGVTTQARAGFRFGRAIETKSHGTFHIYVKACGSQQLTTNGKLYVVTPTGQTGRYSPTIEGSRLEGGAGIAWRKSACVQYYGDFDTSQGTYYKKPWGFNAGVRCSW